jgi:catalase
MNKKHETFWTPLAPTPESSQMLIRRPSGFFSEKQQIGYFPCHARPACASPAPLSEIATGQVPNKDGHRVAVAQANHRGPVPAEHSVDHYRQARALYLRQTARSQETIACALVFELSKSEHAHDRGALVWHLRYVDEDLANRVAAGLAFTTMAPAVVVAAPLQQPAVFLQRPTNANETGRNRMDGQPGGVLNLC